jgi:hypothetical protein
MHLHEIVHLLFFLSLQGPTWSPRIVSNTDLIFTKTFDQTFDFEDGSHWFLAVCRGANMISYWVPHCRINSLLWTTASCLFSYWATTTNLVPYCLRHSPVWFLTVGELPSLLLYCDTQHRTWFLAVGHSIVSGSYLALLDPVWRNWFCISWFCDYRCRHSCIRQCFLYNFPKRK